MLALFAVTAFSSAFLIFLVQPMVGKHILPWFGGVPAVWMFCLCFYQFALFAGYGYAHLSTNHLRVRRQFWVHAVLLFAALAVLPVLPDASWKPMGGAPPGPQILSMLTANVALPFLLLAATAPLLQVWYALAFPGRSPYLLYAFSNAGSLIALLAYPFIIEPHLPLSTTSQAWSWAFGVCGFAILGCAWSTSRSRLKSVPVVPRDPDINADLHTGAADVLLWILLPGCAVVLFMGVTNGLCLDLASFPFLWVVPLAIYLLTYILSFGSAKIYHRGFFAISSAIAMGLLIWFRFASGGSLGVSTLSTPIRILAALYSITLFLTCMLLHGELYRSRPVPARLTFYYLCISGGGVLGGVFVGIVAPQIFSEFYELPIGWCTCWVLFAIACRRRPGSLLLQRPFRLAFVAATALAVGILVVATVREVRLEQGELVYQKRNFFNILRVVERRPANPLMHHMMLHNGTTAHGAQFLQPDRKHLPAMYFGAPTGIGLVMAQRSGEPMDVGVIGLGVGTLAAYGGSRDRFRFYEIDPDVVGIARDASYFSYLYDSPAEIQIVLGDARLSLESELEHGGSNDFDLLVLDAFTSDAIPVHLLTREAFDLYLQHLKPEGVLAVHASSINFDLKPLIFRQADAHGLQAAAISNGYVRRYFVYPTEWVLLTADASYLDGLPAVAKQILEARGIAPRNLYFTFPTSDSARNVPLWTDDYSDLLSALNPASFEKFW